MEIASLDKISSIKLRTSLKTQQIELLFQGFISQKFFKYTLNTILVSNKELWIRISDTDNISVIQLYFKFRAF